MGYKEKMNEAVAEFLREKYNIDAVTVIDFDDRTVYGGYCETCAYEYTEADITYLDSNGEAQVYSYSGTFAELLNSIT